jgi:hypothetical protein
VKTKSLAVIRKEVPVRNSFLRLLAVCLFLLPMVSWGQYYSITCDSQNPTEQFVIDSVFSGNTPFLRSYHYDNGVALNLTGWTMEFVYSYGQYDTNGVVSIPGTVSSNCATFLGATNVFFQAYDKYYFSIKGTHSSGYVKTFATGKMIQRYDPATATNQTTLMGAINMNWWTNNVGAQVESNRVRIALFETSKVDRVAFDGTNLIFEGRIAAEESKSAAQIVSNALYESRIASNEVFRITTQPATNTIFQNLFVAQGNTNSLFQGLLDSLAGTNSLFQGFFNSQTSTNSLFQGWFTAQTGTNSLFQGLLDALASTNSIFQGLFDAQSVTNSVFQGLFNAQANTNAALSASIAAGETGNVSLVTYNAHVSAQANTNSFFQGLLDALAGTNSLFQGWFTAQTDTNAAFEPRIQEGETAYGWGDHASAGYLSATQSIYSALTIADRSQLGTNISGLTQGTYTGSLTSVSYTGVTVMVVGRTYLMGYTKVGASGTSTLSIASQTLTKTTAGATSNYFDYSGTDTNLVLKLDGDGLSICNVSGVYVQQITNGDLHVARNLDVGDSIRFGGVSRTNWPDAAETLWPLASNTVVYTNDSRLTDARAPTAHDQGYTTITDAPWATSTDLTAHTTNTANPHAVTAAQVGAISNIIVNSVTGTVADGVASVTVTVGTGDLKADGSVAMTGDLNGGGRSATNFANLVTTNTPGYQNLLTNTATAAQGTTADNALPKSGGTLSGNIDGAGAYGLTNTLKVVYFEESSTTFTNIGGTNYFRMYNSVVGSNYDIALP